MDKRHQLSLMRGALEDYRDNLMSLGTLIQKIEGILEIIQDQSFKDGVFDSLLALEEVYARTRIGEFDFENDGKPVVDRAVEQILSKTECYPVKLN
jgi:hypothetical protein